MARLTPLKAIRLDERTLKEQWLRELGVAD